ncbi:hypothetical protein [Rhodanobacter sp. MP7CTX1]|uniref:hypothetical protein n=1 Tax=Rhodanobacter sp. MP7CTX1 TaxID=2723084 RepID=UPI00161F2D1A|nr:hypothetical protein [Rhodanobacter sp. MP7CTX1]MBB6186002.1 hypothetical protein [Rhodanobacter sp. MP7CTX1]
MEHDAGKTFSRTHRIGFMLTKARNIVDADIDAGVTLRDIAGRQTRHILWISNGIAAARCEMSRHRRDNAALQMREKLETKGQLNRSCSSTDRRVVDLKSTLRLLGKFDTNTHRQRA